MFDTLRKTILQQNSRYRKSSALGQNGAFDPADVKICVSEGRAELSSFLERRLSELFFSLSE